MHADFHNADEQGGGSMRPPPRAFETKGRRALRKKSADCSRRVLAIGGAFFNHMSIFDPVIRGRSSNFRKIENFQFYVSKSKKLQVVAT